MFVDQSSHHLLLEPASTFVALIDSDSLLLHYFLLAFCLSKTFSSSPISRSLKRCKGNNDFLGIVHCSKICLWTSVSSFTFFVQQCSLVTTYSLGTQVQMPFCTWLTLGTLEMFLCWNTCALVGGLVLTGQCAVPPTPLHCPLLDCQREKIPGVWIFELLGFGIFE